MAGTPKLTDVHQDRRWRRKPVLAAIARCLIVACPLAAGIAAGLLVRAAIGAPQGLPSVIGMYAATLAASLAGFLIVDRAARRLLPLVVLLRVTLVFPDRAPARLAVALRASSRSYLTKSLQNIEGADSGDGLQTLAALATALNGHDRRTRGHSERVRALTELLAKEYHLSGDDLDRLRWGAFLHDIGKLRVPARLLNKRGPLTPAEWRLIAQHPAEGRAIAESLSPWLGTWLDTVDQHHERYDGTGYPYGLKGKDIHLGARLVAVTDSFETMTSVRSYNKPKRVSEAREELVRCAGSDFDPGVVRRFLDISLGRLRYRVGLAAWLAELPLIGLPARAGAELVSIAVSAEPANFIVGCAALTLAGAVTSAVPILSPTVGWAQSHDRPPATVSTSHHASSNSEPTAATAGSPAPPSGSAAGATASPPPSSSSTANPASSPQGNPPSPQPSAAGGGSSFVPPGHGGTPPGQTRITPGRNGVAPPGQGGTPPGHTGIKP